MKEGTLDPRAALALVLMLIPAATAAAQVEDPFASFNPDTDLISLHYDHAPDKDDGQSAAADRTMLETLYGKEWVMFNAIAVSGAYGENAKTFNPDSDAVMNAVFNDVGGWLPAHTQWDLVVALLTARWRHVLISGGDVWVKEGGQSDITAEVIAGVQSALPSVDTTERIHVVQHSRWNEQQTTDEALEFTMDNSDYIKIDDANAYLNIEGGDEAFEAAALAHPSFAASWAAAFDYYDPNIRLDFSDTGELMHILGFGAMSVDEFRIRFLIPGTPLLDRNILE